MLGKQPEMPGFRQWWITMLELVASAHVDSDGAYKWAKQCELSPLNDYEIDNHCKFYAHLDAKWSAALTTVVKGTVGWPLPSRWRSSVRTLKDAGYPGDARQPSSGKISRRLLPTARCIVSRT